MTVYVKELKEEFFTRGDSLPYRTRQTIFGYFLDMESCMKDAEMEDSFYSSRGNYTNLFQQGIRLVLNASVESGSYYTKLSFTWTPTQLLEVNHRGLGAEDFEAEIKYDGAKRYLRGLSTRFEGANNEGFFPAEEEDFEDMVVDEIGEHTELDDEELASEFTGIRKDSKRGYARRGMKRQYERMGMIPSPKGIASFRRKIEVPKGFKYAQMGFLALVVGAFTVSEMRKRE